MTVSDLIAKDLSDPMGFFQTRMECLRQGYRNGFAPTWGDVERVAREAIDKAAERIPPLALFNTDAEAVVMDAVRENFRRGIL